MRYNDKDWKPDAETVKAICVFMREQYEFTNGLPCEPFDIEKHFLRDDET